jgi:hypothetical protein
MVITQGITRYDGTRFITEEEIDQEFTGQWALIHAKKPVDRDGLLIATGPDTHEAYAVLSDMAEDGYELHAKLIFACETRGGSLHVELLG